MLTKNIQSNKPSTHLDAEVIYNEDGTATINPSKDFLIHARQQWNSSLIGHFIRSSFDFKYIKERAFKHWKSKGLKNVYYSSKGYFTFKFSIVEEKDAILRFNSIQVGEKTMYLQNWVEASQFKKNVINRIPCWIRLLDVPQSYWSPTGITIIAKAVGTPLQFDDATAKFEPIKYAGVQVELFYDAPRPGFVWVPVLKPDGSTENIKVEVLYPLLPYSCSLCKAFGHSLARCTDNPEAQKHTTKTTVPQK